jgi:ABC-type transport system involved in multi-copper enzyme maturation permease subunit
MSRKFFELMSWELRDNWSFPILEIVVALTVLQALSFSRFRHDYYGIDPFILSSFFENMLFVLVLSAAIVFGRSFGESVEKRKLLVLLSYPVSRAKLFSVKYLTNSLMLFLVLGLGLLAQGTSLFLFDGLVLPVTWGFAFLYLLLEVLFVSSLMSFFALATRRFGLSILIFLVYMFDMQYWIPINIKAPTSYLLLDLASSNSVWYLEAKFWNLLNINHGTGVPTICFLTGLAYMLGGGLLLFLASLFIMKRMDLD